MGTDEPDGMESLVQRPMEKTTETSILARGMSLTTRY